MSPQLVRASSASFACACEGCASMVMSKIIISESPQVVDKKPQTDQHPSKTDISSRQSGQEPMSAGRSLPLLICSIGNPGSTYANTLHSAGHTAVQRLAEKLRFPPFQKDRQHGNGLISHGTSPTGTPWTLWQSTSYMNESGTGVKAAYKAWSRSMPDFDGKLVVVHDELEKPLGMINLKTTQGASAKGHNGLKSIKSLVGDLPFVRIGVGIGRPVSREPDDVARYVLRKMTPNEKDKISNAIDDIINKLEQVSKG